MTKSNEFTITEASKLLAEKEISSEELTRSFFDEIEKRDKGIHAFLSLNKENALAEARSIDKRRLQGEPLGPVAGITCAIKDNILVRGFPATAGSKILENYQAPYDATAIEKLRRAGAIFIGKTNLDEFAMGSSTENSGFGPTKNPHDPERVPGGSSGGSAAAVAANECIFALGSDTGGSVRQPASFCGVVGLKPTYGAVSRYGLIAMASSLDQIGPIAKTVEDCATVFEVIAGQDPKDSTSSHQAIYADLADVVRYAIDLKGLKVGLPKEYFGGGLEPVVEDLVKKAIKKFEDLGAKILEISLAHTPYALACYYIIMPAEVSANLARYDGIRYGSRKNAEENAEQRGKIQRNSASSPRKSALQEQYFATRGEGFGKEVRRRIMLGTYVLSHGYYEAYYAKAQKVRRLIKRDFEEAFKKVDLILTPTSPVVPFKFGERTEDPLAMYLADVYTVSLNLAGLPGLSIPCGHVKPRTDADGTQNNAEKEFLYPDLTYQIRKAVFDVKKSLGLGHKEPIYQRALEAELQALGLRFEKEKALDISYHGKEIGVYRPDFIVEEKVIVEIKAVPYIGKVEEQQLWSYLKSSPYKLALLVNFGGEDVEIKRIIYDTARFQRQSAAGLRRSAFSPRGSASLPVGLQIIGKHFDEKTILQAAYVYEKSTLKV